MLELPLMEVTTLTWEKVQEEPEIGGTDISDYIQDPCTIDLREVAAVAPCGIDDKLTSFIYMKGGQAFRVLHPYKQMRDAWNAAISRHIQRNLLTNNQ
jgi:hypothetical protein